MSGLRITLPENQEAQLENQGAQLCQIDPYSIPNTPDDTLFLFL
jgi:hypothetical protein